MQTSAYPQAARPLRSSYLARSSKVENLGRNSEIIRNGEACSMEHYLQTTYENYRPGKLTMKVPGASAYLTQMRLAEPTEGPFAQELGYWLDCSLTPRPPNSRGYFAKRAPGQPEPLGTVFMMPPGEVLRGSADAGASHGMICVLQKDQLDRWFDGELRWTDRRLSASLNIQSKAVWQLLRRLSDEVRRPGIASGSYCEALAVQIAVELARYYDALDDRWDSSGLPGWRLRIIDERIRDLTQPPTLIELAELCGVSVRQLTRGFRASRGCSLGDYIAGVRIEGAKRLLSEGQSVKSVAYSTGFSSTASFCCAFRHSTGQTPRQHAQLYDRAGVAG